MSYDLNAIKNIIQNFVDESTEDTFDVYDKGNRIRVNKSIFALESFLVNVRKEKGVNERIDTTIEAPNILSTFEKSSVSNAYTPNDYQYYLLHHLALAFNPDISLYGLIDSFIEKYKTGFSRSDIIITKSGATRCKTNIRFALNSLRYWGLVINLDVEKKRSWSPSLLGLITLLNIRFSEPYVSRKEIFRDPGRLYKPNAFQDLMGWKYALDPLLWASIQQFKQPGHLYFYLTRQCDFALNQFEKEILERIINEFIDFTEEGLIITNNGVEITSKFNELSQKFQENLFETQESNPMLLDKMFLHYREIYKKEN